MDELVLPSRIVLGDFAGWLRDAMAERGLTQRALAMRTGINHATISRLVTGARSPSLSTAVAILRVLGTRPLRGHATTHYLRPSRPSLSRASRPAKDAQPA